MTAEEEEGEGTYRFNSWESTSLRETRLRGFVTFLKGRKSVTGYELKDRAPFE